MATEFPTYPSTTFEQAVELAIFSSNQLHNVINEDANTTIETEDGYIPSLRKALIDNFYFKTPVVWAQGQGVSVFNQLYYYVAADTDISGLYYAPGATTTNIVTMGASPVDDANFVMYTSTANVKPVPFASGIEITAYGRIFYSTNSIGVDGTYAYIGTQMPYNTTASIPENDQAGLWSPSNPTGIWLKLGESNGISVLSAPDGERWIGKASSIANLRTIEPTQDRQRIWLSEYTANTAGKGSGYFMYDASSTSADDAGICIVTAGGKRWIRNIPIDDITIQHFGAVTDGVTDDMTAVKRMFAWSRTLDATFNPGIKIPAGTTALSSWDNGTTEIPSFIMSGPPAVYGRLPTARIVSTNPLNTVPMFSYKARRMAISNIAIIGTSTGVQPFMVNTVTRGDYCRLSVIQARSWGARAFHVYDTIDTTLNQIYSSQGRASFFRTDWSNENPGAWDHPTAIKLVDANFEGHTGEYAFSAIRAGQSVMEDVWFDHCNQGFDISQGGWILKNVTQENSTLASASQYAKVMLIRCRFAQGAGLDSTISGYDPSQDPSGSMPSWVNSVYERGTSNLDTLGFKHSGSFSAGYESSEFKISNMAATTNWFELGTIGFSGSVGASVIIELVGTGHFDAASATAQPSSTSFGGGKATIMVQQKNSATKTSASWYGELASPVKDVRVIQTSATRPRIFVELAGYTGPVGVTFRTGDVSNFEGGIHFYLTAVMDGIDITTVPTAVSIPAQWSVNNGTYGLGVNLTSGILMLDVATSAAFGSTYLPVVINGSTKVIPIQDNMGSVRVPRYAYAELPSAATNVYGIVLCTNSTRSPSTIPLYSNGTSWYPIDDPATAWKPA